MEISFVVADGLDAEQLVSGLAQKSELEGVTVGIGGFDAIDDASDRRSFGSFFQLEDNFTAALFRHFESRRLVGGHRSQKRCDCQAAADLGDDGHVDARRDCNAVAVLLLMAHAE